MREWTEKHIRELVRDEAAKGGAGGGSPVASALLLRLWLADIYIEPITTLSGGTITMTPFQYSNDGSLLMRAKMLYKLDFVNCNWKNDWFVGPTLGYFSAAITPNTIDIGSFWEGILSSLYYHASASLPILTNPHIHQVGNVICDGAETDARINFDDLEDVWYDEKKNISNYMSSEIGGIIHIYGTRIPSGTKTVSVIYGV